METVLEGLIVSRTNKTKIKPDLDIQEFVEGFWYEEMHSENGSIDANVHRFTVDMLKNIYLLLYVMNFSVNKTFGHRILELYSWLVYFVAVGISWNGHNNISQ